MRTGSTLLLAVLITACAGSHRVVERYDDPGYSGQMSRILVLIPGLFPNSGDYARRTVSEALSDRGMAVTTRDEFFAATDRLDREKIVAIVAASDVDGVLLIELAGSSQASRGDFSTAGARGNYGDFEDEIGYLLSIDNMPPAYRETQTELVLRVRLFPETTGQVAWERFIEFTNPGSAFNLIDQAAPVIAAQLANSGLVKGS